MTDADHSHSDVPVVLSIACSDSSAGTGIQADIKTYSMLGVYGTTAITAVTAQTPDEIRGIQPLGPDWLREQILAVCGGFPIAAAKTGMLYTRHHVEVVADADISQGIPILVVDPRMATDSGVQLMQPTAVEALKELLLPLARVVTPNVAEASVLAGFEVKDRNDLRRAAQMISETYHIACVAKGGDLDGDDVIDVLYEEGRVEEYVLPRVDLPMNHGAGCAFSAAITACLAKDMHISEAVLNAKQFVHEAMERARQVGPHHPLNYFHRA